MITMMSAASLRKSISSFRHFFRLRLCSFSSSTNKEVQNFYDITIVGGGMVGASIACALGKC